MHKHTCTHTHKHTHAHTHTHIHTVHTHTPNTHTHTHTYTTGGKDARTFLCTPHTCTFPRSFCNYVSLHAYNTCIHPSDACALMCIHTGVTRSYAHLRAHTYCTCLPHIRNTHKCKRRRAYADVLLRARHTHEHTPRSECTDVSSTRTPHAYRLHRCARTNDRHTHATQKHKSLGSVTVVHYTRGHIRTLTFVNID